jgi:endonuclease YncB( thermonuclease family)
VAFYAYSHRKTDSRPFIIGKAWVVDGDTIEISGIRIRLEGIDAPEWEQTCGEQEGNKKGL